MDAVTTANFKQANPGLTPNAEDNAYANLASGGLKGNELAMARSSLANHFATQNVDTSKPIEAARFGNTNNTYPTPANTTTAHMKLGATVTGLAEQNAMGQSQAADEAQMQAKATPTTPTNTRQSILDKFLGLSDKLGNKGADTLKAQQEEGVNDKKKLSRDLENQYISKTRAYDKQIEDIRKNSGGDFGGATEQKITEVERMKNQELADIAIQQKVAVEDYQAAFDIAKEKVDAKYEPLQNQIDTLKDYYQLSANDLTETEKMQAQALIQSKQDDKNFQQQKELAAINHQYSLSEKLYSHNLDTSGDGADSDILAYTQALQAGTATLAQVPQKLRGKVIANVQATGTNKLLGLLGQYRDTVKGLSFISANLPENKAILDTLKGQITAVYKQQQQLGTLDNGVQVLVDKIIPDPSKPTISSLSNAAQIAAIDNFIKNQTPANAAGTTTTGKTSSGIGWKVTP